MPSRKWFKTYFALVIFPSFVSPIPSFYDHSHQHIYVFYVPYLFYKSKIKTKNPTLNLISLQLTLHFYSSQQIFLKLLFQNNYSFTGSYKNSRKKSCVPFTQLSSTVTSYITVQKQNQKIDIGTIYRP